MINYDLSGSWDTIFESFGQQTRTLFVQRSKAELFPESLRRGRQSLTESAFLFVSFFFVPFSAKEKAANSLDRLTYNKGKPPLVRFPSLRFAQIHPFVALANAMGISPSAEGDHRSARWTCGRFLKKATQKLSINPTDKHQFIILRFPRR